MFNVYNIILLSQEKIEQSMEKGEGNVPHPTFLYNIYDYTALEAYYYRNIIRVFVSVRSGKYKNTYV